MATKVSADLRNRLKHAVTDEAKADELVELIESIVDARWNILMQKLDNDTGVTDTDFESILKVK